MPHPADIQNILSQARTPRAAAYDVSRFAAFSFSRFPAFSFSRFAAMRM